MCQYITCYHEALCFSLSPDVIRLHVPVCHLMSLGFMCQYATLYHEDSCVSISPAVMRIHVLPYHLLSS